MRTGLPPAALLLLATACASPPSGSGTDTTAPAGYDVPEPGFKSAMHDVAAAVGIHQLAGLDEVVTTADAVQVGALVRHAELERKREGKKTRTDMSEKELEKMARF